MVSSILKLPPEIIYKIFKLAPVELSGTCRFFYAMLNQYYEEKMIKDFGPNIFENMALNDLPALVNYVKSLDFWRKTQRNIISRYQYMKDYSTDTSEPRCYEDLINYNFIRDSWRVIYGIYKSRVLYFNRENCKVDEPQSYIDNGFLRVNRTYLVKYQKHITLVPGSYRFCCAVILNKALGFSSTNFKIVEHNTGKVLCNYFPPSTVNDIVPQNKLSMLNMGNFTVDEPNGYNDDPLGDKFIDLDVIVEESGLYLKSGFTLCYLSILPNESSERADWISWTIENENPTPDKIINTLLQNVYRSISNPERKLPCLLRDAVNTVRNQHQCSTGENLETYSQKFYSRLNSGGQEIIRSVRYRTVIDKRRHEDAIKRGKQMLQSEPLRWKMPHVLVL